MLNPKLKQSLHQLRFAARLLRNFETAKRGELDVNVTNPSRSAADPVQQLQQLFVLSIACGKHLFEERFEAAARGAEIVNGLWIGVGRQPRQIAVYLAENEFAAVCYRCHTCEVMRGEVD